MDERQNAFKRHPASSLAANHLSFRSLYINVQMDIVIQATFFQPMDSIIRMSFFLEMDQTFPGRPSGQSRDHCARPVDLGQ